MTLANKALLVDLDISQWSARKLDRRETNEVNVRNGARSTVARVNKSLLPGANSLDRANKKAAAIRDWFYGRTLPWAGTARILNSLGYLEFTAEYRQHISEWVRMVDQFVAEYPALVLQAQLELAGLYNPDDYPDTSDIRSKFSIRTRFQPVPEAGDWRVGLADDALQELRDSVTRDVKQAQQAAMGEAWKRLQECVEHAVAKLRDPKAIFRDSLVENAEKLCHVLPTLNITGDPELEARRQELERVLGGVDPKDLRRFPDMRKRTATQLSDIMNKMSGLYQVAA